MKHLKAFDQLFEAEEISDEKAEEMLANIIGKEQVNQIKTDNPSVHISHGYDNAIWMQFTVVDHHQDTISFCDIVYEINDDNWYVVSNPIYEEKIDSFEEVKRLFQEVDPSEWTKEEYSKPIIIK